MQNCRFLGERKPTLWFFPPLRLKAEEQTSRKGPPLILVLHSGWQSGGC